MWNVSIFFVIYLISKFEIFYWYTCNYDGISFLPEAKVFGLWVLSSPASVRVCLSVCVSVCVCVDINHGFVQMITWHLFKVWSPNLGHDVQNTLVESSIVFVDWPWTSRSNLTPKSNIAKFANSPLNNLANIQGRNSNLHQENQSPCLQWIGFGAYWPNYGSLMTPKISEIGGRGSKLAPDMHSSSINHPAWNDLGLSLGPVGANLGL